MHRDEGEHDEKLATNLFKRLRILTIGGVLIFLFSTGLYTYKFGGTLSDSQEKWGQFGDFVGGLLNPVFSLLALIALLATFSLQIREYRISTQELRNSAKALSDQHAVMFKQSFEASFFQLLSLHNEIINGIDLVDQEGQITKGRDCFSSFLRRINVAINKNFGARANPIVFNRTYAVFYNGAQREIEHYFKMLYCILKLVQDTDNIDKEFYGDIVRAQLSSPEVSLLSYHCMSQRDGGKLKPLVEDFALLENISSPQVTKELLMASYSREAFGGTYTNIL